MKALPFIILSGALLLGCGHQDPIDSLIHRISHEDVPSYPFKPIELPATATPEELIGALSRRGVGNLAGFRFSDYKIVEIRQVQTEPPFSQKFTAVRLDTDLGQKIVLLRPLGKGTNWSGWYYKTYDAK